VAGVAVSAAFLLTPSRFTPEIPGDEALGTLFSGTLKANRDYDVAEFLPSYRGTLVALLQTHREFEVVTPRTLAKFTGKALVLPNVTMLNDIEKGEITAYSQRGGHLIVTGADVTGLPKSDSVGQLAFKPDANSMSGASTCCLKSKIADSVRRSTSLVV